MIVTRWQANIIPSKDQLMQVLALEGLDPFVEILKPQEKVLEHRHPFQEVRIIVSGQLLYNIAGNQLLLRTGDKVEIASNTKHWHANNGQEDCVCVCAYRTS